MNLQETIKTISSSVVRIQTQNSYGTGFIFWENQEVCCIATASHVIEPAIQEGWEQPILITQSDGKSLRLYPHDRWVVPRLNDGDSAAIVVRKEGFTIPNKLIPLQDEHAIPIGSKIGWLGYPGLIDPNIVQPSFFSGVVSNIFTHPLNQYVIDGVSIHGVSGGPVFYLSENGKDSFIIGSISSYHVNRVPVGGNMESWPGLLLSHNVSAFKPVIEHLETLEEAKNQDDKSLYEAQMDGTE